MAKDEATVETSELEAKSQEIAMGRTGVDTSNEQTNSSESPLEEARRLNKETKETIKKLVEERQILESMLGQNAVAGRSYSGTPKVKTQEEIDTEDANIILRRFKSGF